MYTLAPSNRFFAHPARTSDRRYLSDESLNKKYYSHRGSDRHDERARQRLRHAPKEARAEISTEQRDERHRNRKSPVDDARNNERYERDAVDRSGEHVLDRVLRVKGRQSRKGEHREHQDSHAGAEVASVNRNGELHGDLPRRVVRRRAGAARQEWTRCKYERGEEQQPGYHPLEERRRRHEQERRADQRAGNAGDNHWQEQRAVLRDLFAIAVRAAERADPHRGVVRRVSRNRRNARDEQRREGEKAPAARDTVHRAGQQRRRGGEDKMGARHASYRAVRSRLVTR